MHHHPTLRDHIGRHRRRVGHRFRARRYRPLLCSSMRRIDVVILVTLVTLIWLGVGLWSA